MKHKKAAINFILIIGLLSLPNCSKPTKHNGPPLPPYPPNYTDCYPSYSPNGRYIAYAHASIDLDENSRFGQFSIWVYDLRLKRYGYLVGPGLFPRWSPDGSILAFNWGNEIYFYYLATQTVRQVTHLGREIYIFQWSGDGRYICADYGHLWLIDTTGRITKTIRPRNGSDTGWAAGSDANWTASGDSILTLGGFSDINIWSIFVIDSLGNLIHTVLSRQLYSEIISCLAWSPYHNKFAANYSTRIGNSTYSDLRIYSMDGSVAGIISEEAGMATWSPDGHQIVFQKYTWMGDNPDPQGIDYSRITIWVCDSYGRFAYELMGWPQQGYDSTMFFGGYNWLTDTHAP